MSMVVSETAGNGSEIRGSEEHDAMLGDDGESGGGDAAQVDPQLAEAPFALLHVPSPTNSFCHLGSCLECTPGDRNAY